MQQGKTGILMVTCEAEIQDALQSALRAEGQESESVRSVEAACLRLAGELDTLLRKPPPGHL